MVSPAYGAPIKKTAAADRAFNAQPTAALNLPLAA
jgi:hypothetical protein